MQPAILAHVSSHASWSVYANALIPLRSLTRPTATKFFSPKQPDAATPSTVAQDSSRTEQQGSQAVAAQKAVLGWPLGIPLTMHVYFSTTPDGSDVFANQWSSDSGSSKTNLPNFVWENITYGDFKESRTVDLVLDLPDVSERRWCPRQASLIFLTERTTQRISLGGYIPGKGWC